jgi:hypothetical protein
MGVQYDATFSGIISAGLKNRGVEVLNAGVASYSPIIYLRKMEHLIDLGFTLDHLIVFIDMSDIRNEIKDYRFDENRSVVDRTPYGMGVVVRNWLSRNTIFYSRLRLLIHELKLKPNEGLIANRPEATWAVNEDLFEEWGRQGLELASENMNRLHDLSIENDFSLTIAVYPWPENVWHRDLNSRQVKFWSEWANKRDVHLINYFPNFITDDGEREDIIRAYFIHGDVHWNQAGHRVIAQELLPYIQESLLD